MATTVGKRQQTAAVMALFDLVVESSVEGLRKPNPIIYETTCERLGVAPSACVFLDDLGVNLKPARAPGHDHHQGRDGKPSAPGTATRHGA